MSDPGTLVTGYDRTSELVDFADTAAFVSALDLVISVDTAVAHLAGTLGRPVWWLNRRDTDWRWLLEHDDKPLVSDASPVPETRDDDWGPVVARVQERAGRLDREDPQ